MAGDDEFERKLSERLRSELDGVHGPQSSWTTPTSVELRRLARARFAPRSGSAPVGARLAVAAAMGLVAVLIVGLASEMLLGSGPPSSLPPSGLLSTASLGTDVRESIAPHVAGTCPLTPVTRLVSGVAPEVDSSGLQWRWGGVSWVAGIPEKVVWLTDGGETPSVSVVATQLDLPIVLGGQLDAYPGAASHAVYALATEASVAGLIVPQPGCWLVLATWVDGASSVVVAVGPSAGPTPRPPAASPAPGGSCPSSVPSSVPPAQGWPGPDYVDGPFRWLLPSRAGWQIGGTGDKLVLDSELDWKAADRRIIALPVGRRANDGGPVGFAVLGDIPPGFGGGTMGVGITLPTRDCWALVYVDAATTSTIVDDLTAAAPVAAWAPDAVTALDVAGHYENALAGDAWSSAWALLSDRSQAAAGSLTTFAADGTTFNAQGGAVFSLQTPTQDAALVATFLGASQPAIALEVDSGRGYLVFVQHPEVRGASAGSLGLYVAPLKSGDWRIWVVH